jgi:hypothetical protein
MSGNPYELPSGAADNPVTSGSFSPAEDPWAAVSYQQWGPTESDMAVVPAAGSDTTPGSTTIGNQQLQFADQEMMTLSAPDQQAMMQLWAQSNGLDANDQNSYAQVSQSADGRMQVGPFKLDAGNIVNNWASGMINSEGVIDQGALQNYVQQGRLSPETAAKISTPEFMQFMQGMANGQQPTPEQIQQFLPPDLQQAIAGDLTNAAAAIVGMQGGSLDSQSVLSTLQSFTNPTETEQGGTAPTKGASTDAGAAYGDQGAGAFQPELPSYAQRWAEQDAAYKAELEAMGFDVQNNSTTSAFPPGFGTGNNTAAGSPGDTESLPIQQTFPPGGSTPGFNPDTAIGYDNQAIAPLPQSAIDEINAGGGATMDGTDQGAQ